MVRSSRTLAFARWLRAATAGTALLAAPADVAFAQTVNYLLLTKSISFNQSSATGVAPVPVSTPCNFGCPYRFGAVIGGLGLGGIAAPTIAGPINVASLGAFWNSGQFAQIGGQWQFGPTGDWHSPTQADLDSRFGSGTYTIVVNGTTVALNLSGDAYPNMPIVTLSGGRWSEGKYLIDANQPLTLTTNAFTTYGARPNDAIHVFIGAGGVGNISDNYQFYSGQPGSNTLTRTLPANTFVNGQEYYLGAEFQAVVDKFPNFSIAKYSAITNVSIKAQSQGRAPVFPMTVTATIGPTLSNATAVIQYLPQDVGTAGSVYVFAVAPATVVSGATAPASLGMTAKAGSKDVAVQCVLAQLNASGQLQAVSAANLQAFVTGVLSAQGQAVTILNNVATANIAGATLYVGYGANAPAMMANGANNRAVSVPGAIQCDPQPPRTGWWWNTAEGGRGYSIESAGNHLFFASYLYDVSGRATWLVASGNTSLDGALFTGQLESYAQGQTLTGPYRPPNPVVYAGPITLAFNDASHGTLSWPGGNVPIERFNIVPGGVALAKRADEPESGWWWNAAESGRGYFLEWQGGQLFIAGYMYDDAGNPIWYLTQDVTPDSSLQTFGGNWWQFANGPALTGPFRQATRVNDNVAPVSITFSGPETGIMTLPGGRTTAIRRFRF